jgi:exopolyphosphatase/guanosine-5'-triphosphate,3'-diphosphate pyrophosphatase
VAKDGKGHHKESARLIREHAWQHWAAPDVNLIAIIARHHRKAPPGAEHEDFTALSEHDQHRVRHLAALLRLGDALDRSHTQRITKVEVAILPDAVELTLTSERPLEAETESVKKKSDLACAVWQRAVRLVRRRN